MREAHRPQPTTEDELFYCPACGSVLEWEDEEYDFLPTRRVCPEHGGVTIDFQEKARHVGYWDFEGAIHLEEWIRCPSCAYLGLEIPEPQAWQNVYFECPGCGQKGIV